MAETKETSKWIKVAKELISEHEEAMKEKEQESLCDSGKY